MERGMASDGKDSSPTEKKRMQNRVAQRLYRQRMKARMEALQAKLDSIEGNSQQGPPRSAPSTENSAGTHTSHDTSHSFTAVERHKERQFPAPTARMVPDDRISVVSDSSGPTVAGKAAVQHKDAFQTSTWETTGSVSNGQASNEPSPTASMGLEQPANFEVDLNSAASNFPFDAAHATNDPSFWDFSMATGTTPVDHISAQALSLDQSLSTDAMQAGMQLPFLSGFETTSLSNLSSGQATTSMDKPPQPAETNPVSEASLEERMSFVDQQAKLAGFRDLEALITAYYSTKDSISESSTAEDGSTRRLPQLIATIRHALREWKEWEKRGFPLD